MTATTRRVGRLRHRVDVNGRHVIVTDEPALGAGIDFEGRVVSAPLSAST